LYDFSLQNKNLTAFLWENGVKAKQQKKSPAGSGPAFQRCTFSLGILVKVKVPKRKPLPTARFSSKFCYKVTCEQFALNVPLGQVQLKTVKGDLLMELSLVEFFHPAFAGVTLTR